MDIKTRKVVRIVEPDLEKRREMGIHAPSNCPVGEKTGDGVPVGRCWYHLGEDGNTCPRHGDISQFEWPVLR